MAVENTEASASAALGCGTTLPAESDLRLGWLGGYVIVDEPG